MKKSFFVVSIVLALMAIVFSFSGCASKELAQTIVSMPKDPDQILVNDLKREPLSPSEAKDALLGVRLFEVNGKQSSRSWIKENTDGTFTVIGTLANSASTWSPQDGISYTFTNIQVSEEVSDLKIYHTIPLLIPPEARIETTEREYLASEEEDLFSSDLWNIVCLVKATFRVQGKAIEVLSLEEVPNSYKQMEKYPLGITTNTFNSVLDADRIEAQSIDKSEPWLKISTSGKWVRLTGSTYDSGTVGDPELRETLGTIVVEVPDLLGSATIYHVAEVYFPEKDYATKRVQKLCREGSRPQQVDVQFVSKNLRLR